MFLHAAKAVKPPPILTLSVKPQRKGEGGAENHNFKVRFWGLRRRMEV